MEGRVQGCTAAFLFLIHSTSSVRSRSHFITWLTVEPKNSSFHESENTDFHVNWWFSGSAFPLTLIRASKNGSIVWVKCPMLIPVRRGLHERASAALSHTISSISLSRFTSRFAVRLLGNLSGFYDTGVPGRHSALDCWEYRPCYMLLCMQLYELLDN